MDGATIWAVEGLCWMVVLFGIAVFEWALRDYYDSSDSTPGS